MKVDEAVARAFVKEGTTTAFGLMGDGNMSWAAAMTKVPGARIIDARDEGAALGFRIVLGMTLNQPINNQEAT